MFTAGKSYLGPGSVTPTPHHTIISPANGSLSSRRLGAGVWSWPLLPLSCALGLRGRVCQGQPGGRATPLGRANLCPPRESAQSHWPLADAGPGQAGDKLDTQASPADLTRRTVVFSVTEQLFPLLSPKFQIAFCQIIYVSSFSKYLQKAARSPQTLR